MSDATKAALEDAIAAHIADETDGSIAQAYVLIVEDTTFEDLDHDLSSRFVATRDGQSFYTTQGLLWATLNREGDPDDD